MINLGFMHNEFSFTMKKNAVISPTLAPFRHRVTDKRFEVLQALAEAGSISEAARRASISYKSAWQAIETLSNLAGGSVVTKIIGGKGGGGALLTPLGESLLSRARTFHQAQRQFLQSQVNPHFTPILGLQTSMRNQLHANIERITTRGGVCSIKMVLRGGQSMQSSITRESRELLGIQRGDSVLVLFKATAVAITLANQDQFKSADNRLMGKVVRNATRRVPYEISLAIAEEIVVVGFTELPPKPRLGAEAIAHINSSAVVISPLP
jgi:molybdate transport system regulatory protein